MGHRPPALRSLRVVLGYDLSPGAQVAADLVAGASWPDGTVVRVVSSPFGIGPGLSTFARLSEARIHQKAVQATITAAHQRLAADLRRAGVVVESRTVHGRPERGLIAEAEDLAADLIVVGARDQAPLSATLLGSVSRAVVERASTSVLVARGRTVGTVVLTADGSPPARLATTIVASWPLFANTSTVVVGVGGDAPPRDVPAIGAGAAIDATAQPGVGSPTGLPAVVNEAVQRLEAAGRAVEARVGPGDPAAEVVASSRAISADVVVIGANGDGFLRRMLLGTVARKVLDGVRSSVLVVRLGRTEDAG